MEWNGMKRHGMAWQDMKSQVRPGQGKHQHKDKLILNRLHVMVRKLETV